MSTTPPAARGRPARVRLAAALKAARAASNLSQPVVAERIGHPQSWVSKIETGALLPSVEDTKTLCRIYKITGPDRRELLALIEGLREEQSRRVILTRGIASTQQRIGELETSATEIRAYQPCLVVGLVQTPGYMRALFAQPDLGLTPEQIDGAIEARLRRQAILQDSRRAITILHTEGALRWQIGGPAVMAEQLDHLAELANGAGESPRIGIIPWTTTVDVATNSAFQVIDRDAVMITTEIANLTPTGAADVDAYRHRFDTLERLAVFGAAAEQHLRRIGQEYGGLAERAAD